MRIKKMCSRYGSHDFPQWSEPYERRPGSGDGWYAQKRQCRICLVWETQLVEYGSF